MTDHDKAMRDHASNTKMPSFETPAFTSPPPLSEATVAIVTSAALHRGATFWGPGDTHFERLPVEARDLSLGHLSPNFDRSGFAADLNVVYPIDRLNELAEKGSIGRVAPHHYACAGNQDEMVSTLRLDTGPHVAKELLEDGVDVVLLTPV